MKVIMPSESLEDMLQKGVILWRHAYFMGGNWRACVNQFKFELADRGSYMARLRFGAQGMAEPEVMEAQSSGGITIFLKEVPPSNWTHLVIDGISNGLRSRAGGCLFASAPEPYSMEAYILFRSHLNAAWKEEDFETNYEVSKRFWVRGTRLHDKRCVVHQYDFEYEYEILRAFEPCQKP